MMHVRETLIKLDSIFGQMFNLLSVFILVSRSDLTSKLDEGLIVIKSIKLIGYTHYT